MRPADGGSARPGRRAGRKSTRVPCSLPVTKREPTLSLPPAALPRAGTASRPSVGLPQNGRIPLALS